MEEERLYLSYITSKIDILIFDKEDKDLKCINIKYIDMKHKSVSTRDFLFAFWRQDLPCNHKLFYFAESPLAASPQIQIKRPVRDVH
jgi:hypothetical protein